MAAQIVIGLDVGKVKQLLIALRDKKKNFKYIKKPTGEEYTASSEHPNNIQTFK